MCECCPGFLVSVSVIVSVVVVMFCFVIRSLVFGNVYLESCWIVRCIIRIMVHSFCFILGVSGNEGILVMKYMNTAILCSIWWFE